MNEENQHAAVELAAPAAETPLSAVESTEVAVDTPLAEEGKGVQPKKRAPHKPKPQVDSVEDLLKLAYESNARLLEFSKESLKKLPITDEGITAQGALIASLSPTDPTLATSFRLLQYVARQGVDLKRADDGDLAPVLRRLVDLSIVAMSNNPVFRVWTDQLLDPRREPQLSPQHVRDEADKVDAEKLGLAADQFKAADSDRLVKNAVASYGLLRAVQRDWNLNRYIDELNDSSWKYEVPEAASLERAVGTIGSSRDLDVLGLVAANYIARIARLDRQIAQLERAVDAAANRESRLNEELQAARASEQAATARAEAFSTDIVRLQKELAAERDNRVVDKSHMADDYETLRTRIIRRLSGEIDLLTDGLHALRNGAPSVAEEFLDRSLLALAREVEQLKDAAGGLA